MTSSSNSTPRRPGDDRECRCGAIFALLAPAFYFHPRLRLRPTLRAFLRAFLARFSLAVVLVALLFAYIYYATAFVVLVPWLSFSVHGVFHVTLFSMLAGLALLAYIQCVVGDPGVVPPTYIPDSEQSTSLLEVRGKGKGEGLPFPTQCMRRGPLRVVPACVPNS